MLLFGGEGSSDGAGELYSLDCTTWAWSKPQIQGTCPVNRSMFSLDLIGPTERTCRAFLFGGVSPSGGDVADLYVLDIKNSRWHRPLSDSSLSSQAHASAILHDKLVVFGGLRIKKDKPSDKGTLKVSKKLFFSNVLEIREGTRSGEGDFKFKLVTVGDSGVGKSCLLTRFVSDVYSDFHISTIGVDFKTVVTMVKGRLTKLQLWDTAGQERFSVVTGNYYRNADGFIFVYDATNRQSFDHVEMWLSQVQQHHDCGPETIKILVGNKYDLKSELQVTEEEAQKKADGMGAFFVSTSAKTAENVDATFLTAAQRLVDMRRQRQQQSQPSAQGGGGVSLDSRNVPGRASSTYGKCCEGGASSLFK